MHTGALVLGIDVQGGRATAVRWASGGREHRAVAGREVLLCAGAVGSPHILLRSGIGPADELAAVGIPVVHDLPGVGNGLVDHPVVPASFRAGAGSLLDAQSVGAVARYLVRRAGPLASNVAQAGAFVASRDGLPAPDLQLTFGPVFLGDVGDSHVVKPTEHGVTLGAILLRPASRGRVTLRSGDPAAPPWIDPGYLTEPADAEALLHGLRLLLDLAGTPALRPHAQTRHAPADTSAAGRRADLRATTTHDVPPRRHLPDGGRPDGRRRPVAARARPGRAAGRGRLGDADDPRRQHQRPHHCHRRAGRRPAERPGATNACGRDRTERGGRP